MRGLRFASRSRPSQDFQNAIENDRTNTVHRIESFCVVLVQKCIIIISGLLFIVENSIANITNKIYFRSVWRKEYNLFF